MKKEKKSAASAAASKKEQKSTAGKTTGALKKIASVIKKLTGAKSKKVTSTRSALAESEFMNATSDPAHAPGHKKMNLRNQFQKTGHKNTSQNVRALNEMSPSNKIKRTSATNRRIITGAAVGKTGQVTIK